MDQAHRRNSFDALRLLGATLVLLGHSFALTGGKSPEILGQGFHIIGVKMFFIISGYLITKSWLRDPNFISYAMKRAFRIMPALLAVVILTVLVLGAILSSDDGYFSNTETWKYLWRNSLLLPYHELPGVFDDNPWPKAVNGSLWTLPVEVIMYVATPLILLFRQRWLAVAIAILFFVLPLDGEIAGFSIGNAASVIPWFIVGMAAQLFHVPAPTWPAIHPKIDISYGMYLIAFPTQQTIVHLVPNIGPAALTIFALCVTVPLAALSWICVEAPMLGLLRQIQRNYFIPRRASLGQ